jgi:sugar phosphate isomerase/epimerase
MTAKPISVQLYTVRELAKQDFFGTLKQIADIGYAGVEFAGLHDKKPEEVRRVIDDLGLKASSAHGVFPGLDKVDEVAATAAILGYKYYVVPYLPPSRFASVDEIRRTAEVIQATAELLKNQGVTLGYHNHPHEMIVVDGQLALERLFDAAPGLSPELDIYWASNFGLVDVPKLVRKYAKRCGLLHVKDGPLVKGQAHLALGTGKMDLPTIINAADDSVLEWLVVELDQCDTDMLTAVRESYQYLVKTKLGKGTK